LSETCLYAAGISEFFWKQVPDSGSSDWEAQRPSVSWVFDIMQVVDNVEQKQKVVFLDCMWDGSDNTELFVG